ncbi:Domain of uncharacterised function (DUF2825) [Klebsiella pneumoniae]|nr:Domain of uncharacterised function (DUF2825) [Klebsiella pneumoniae]VVK46752.1 Domain of uncharacterised function (DUF2825) [Klebsiella pneumoniae]
MWGRPRQGKLHIPHQRNTPTHVGKTLTGTFTRTNTEKHPHACREDQQGFCQYALRQETPPHMWGRPRHLQISGIQQRKHPHACGEDNIFERAKTASGETPPRMWGRLIDPASINQLHRNTPTHVGKTSGGRLSSLRTSETPPRMWGRPAAAGYPAFEPRKHPHACGEDRTKRSRVTFLCGNTPTHVGKTMTKLISSMSRWKHPHACGEDHDETDIFNVTLETPPRMWGRPDIVIVRQSSARNTPTHVGKTPFAYSPISRGQKHPHACGEDLGDYNGVKDGLETPPRMWGRRIPLASRIM